MHDSHALLQIGRFVTREQQAAKEMVDVADTRLKNLRAQTQRECRRDELAARECVMFDGVTCVTCMTLVTV